MICPICGTHVADDIDICPACHADLSLTRSLPRLQGTFCPGCGALVLDGENYCPSCGTPVEGDHDGERKRRAELLSEVPHVDESSVPEDDSKQDTHILARIDSAIPDEPEQFYEERVERRGTSMRMVVLAAIASLVIVGGFVLYAAHPWDPRAMTPDPTPDADLSQVGYPGAIEHLAGQDTGVAATDMRSADEITYEEMHTAYDKLLDIDARIGELDELLFESCRTYTAQERSDAYAQASALAIELSNLINEIGEIDVTTGTYESDLNDLLTLASWQRNRLDALVRAWEIAAGTYDPEGQWDTITYPVLSQRNPDGTDTYKALFDEEAPLWNPAEP